MAFITASGLLNRSLASLKARIAEQRGLLQCVQAALPPELAVNVRHCLETGRKIIVFTDSAVWAAQLRFHEQAILAAAAAFSGRPAAKLRVRVLAVTLGPNAGLQAGARQPSAQTLAALSALYPNSNKPDSDQADPEGGNAKNDELVESWQKLVRTLQKHGA